MSNVGGKPSKSGLEKISSYKIIIFTTLLGGLVNWIAYRSQLTADLSVHVFKYPFNDLESLSKTNYL